MIVKIHCARKPVMVLHASTCTFEPERRISSQRGTVWFQRMKTSPLPSETFAAPPESGITRTNAAKFVKATVESRAMLPIGAPLVPVYLSAAFTTAHCCGSENVHAERFVSWKSKWRLKLDVPQVSMLLGNAG